jgi:hypothetical protein
MQRACVTEPLVNTYSLSITTKEFVAGSVDLQTSCLTRFKPWCIQGRLHKNLRDIVSANTLLHCKPSYYVRPIISSGKAITYIYSALVEGTFDVRQTGFRVCHFSEILKTFYA